MKKLKSKQHYISSLSANFVRFGLEGVIFVMLLLAAKAVFFAPQGGIEKLLFFDTIKACGEYIAASTALVVGGGLFVDYLVVKQK